MDDWIEVFRTGTHIDSAGNTREYSEADLDKIVSTYNPQQHEAPIVIGHPEANAPAFGWVSELKRSGNTLLAKPTQVYNEFAQMVQDGLFKKRSIALYPDGSLRHVGFLGAQPPAVKGLRDITFSSCDDICEYEFEEKKNNKRLNMDELQKAREELAKSKAEFAEKEKAFTKELEKKEKEVLAAKEASEALQRAAVKAENATFCEGLIKAGKLLPAQKNRAVELLGMVGQSTGEFEFSEGGKKSGVDAMREFFSSLPTAIEYAELAKKDKAACEGKTKTPKEIAVEAQAYKAEQEKQGNKITTTEAVAYVTKNKGGN